MTDRLAAPRVTPLPKDAPLDDDLASLFQAMEEREGSVLHIFGTLARHPGLFRKWLPFGGKLLAGKLPARDRELLILRTAWNTRSDYEWGQHVTIAAAAGLTDEEIGRVAGGGDDGAWAEPDRLLLRVADQLHTTSGISDDDWAALAERYDEAQLIELPLLVGHYHMVAFTLNALGVQREEGVPGLPG